MDIAITLDDCQPGLSFKFAQAIDAQNISSRTSKTYLHWITQYLHYYDHENPAKLSERNVKEFLRHIVQSLSPSRAKLNQAREAIIFFYSKVVQKQEIADKLTA